MARVRFASDGWRGGPGLNTFYFQEQASGVPVDPTQEGVDLVTARVHDAMAGIGGLFPAPWHGQVNPFVDVLNPVNGDLMGSFSAAPTAVINGSSGSGFLPPQTMGLAQLRTSAFDDGRKIQGRAFFGPLAATIDADGSPNAAVVTTLTNWGVAMLDVGITHTPDLVVWRRPREARTTPKVVTQRDGRIAVVTSITVPDKYATLRSRRD